MNMIFSHRETVEFRLHTPTTNAYKMVNWLYICVAILKYAHKHQKEILKGEKVTFKDVLNIYANTNKRSLSARRLTEYLIAYFESRKARFSADYKKGDVLSNWDITEDKDYEFVHNGVSLV